MIETITAWLTPWLGPHIDWKQVILVALSPLFIGTFLVEWWVMRRRGTDQGFKTHDILTNLNLGATYQIFELVVHALFFMAAMHWVYQFRVVEIPITAWTLPLIFLGVEFCYYWFHRTSHRVRWFWSAHVVHHSGEHMNLTTAMRQSMLYSLTGYWLFFTPLMLLGVRPELVLALYACNLAFQYFVHTEAVHRLPAWIEYVFVTPSHHRVHHARNPEYIDKNYGGVLILFDRWFGTFAAEEAPVEYGIVRQIRSHNLWTLNTHELVDLFRDVAQPGPWRERLKHFWAPPEWQRPSSDTETPQS